MGAEPGVGVLYVKIEPRDFKGAADLLQEALGRWKPGRRLNVDLEAFTYANTIADRIHIRS